MEVNIVSKETIKPSSESTQHQKPHKLCLLDQIIPLTYATCVLFYPNILSPESNFSTSTISKTLAHLKKSLSETLNLYYPFSGRITSDIYVEDFDSGVPFSEARIECRMSEYFKLGEAESLNKLLPFPPFRKETNGPTLPIPLLAFQANVFSCGGLALGASLCHKIADGVSMFYLFSSWAALSRGASDEVIKPNFSGIATFFPAVTDLPEKYSGLFDRMCFKEGNYVTRRFVFGAKAVEALRGKARIGEDDDLPKPTRNEAVSCFIWKHVTEASWAVSGSRQGVSVASHSVNFRGKLKQLQNPIGNLLWMVGSAAEGARGGKELPELVKKLREAMEEYESDFRGMAEQGYEEGSGSKVLLRKLENSVALFEQLEAKPVDLRFSNWKGFFNEVDFGWGRPFRVGVMGKVGPAFTNSVFLVDSQLGKGIEATVTLEEKLMAALERDIEFLDFASLDQGIISSL